MVNRFIYLYIVFLYFVLSSYLSPLIGRETLFSYNLNENPSGAGAVVVVNDHNLLPGTQYRSSLGNGYGDPGSHKCSPDVGKSVIISPG